jgi:hypothetical protein
MRVPGLQGGQSPRSRRRSYRSGQGDAEEGEPMVGVTEELVEFVRHISTRPETWLDFPLFISERYADGKH